MFSRNSKIPLTGPAERGDDAPMQPRKIEVRHIAISGTPALRRKVLVSAGGKRIDEWLKISGSRHTAFRMMHGKRFVSTLEFGI